MLVKVKRSIVDLNDNFLDQLLIWGACGYDPFEMVDGIRKEKRMYRAWKAKRARSMMANERERRRMRG